MKLFHLRISLQKPINLPHEPAAPQTANFDAVPGQEKLLGKYSHAPFGHGEPRDVRYNCLHDHQLSVSHQHRDFLRFWGPDHRHRYSTRVLRTNAIIKISGEVEAASYAHNNYDTLASRYCHARPNPANVHTRHSLIQHPLSLLGRRRAIHHTRNHVLNLNRRSNETAAVKGTSCIRPDSENRLELVSQTQLNSNYDRAIARRPTMV